MNREIKFRAWEDSTELECPQMHSHSDLDRLDREGLVHLFDIINGREKHFKLMQYTGEIIDGEEVYIGDIVALYLDGREYFRGKVTDHGAIGITIDSKNDYMEFRLTRRFTYKLLGNIYENPELLEK